MTDKLSQSLDEISKLVSSFETSMLDKYIPVECGTAWEYESPDDQIGFDKVEGRWRLVFWYATDQDKAIPVGELPIPVRLEVLSQNPFSEVEKTLSKAQDDVQSKADEVVKSLNDDLLGF